jgi:hypothetical protein
MLSVHGNVGEKPPAPPSPPPSTTGLSPPVPESEPAVDLLLELEQAAPSPPAAVVSATNPKASAARFMGRPPEAFSLTDSGQTPPAASLVQPAGSKPERVSSKARAVSSKAETPADLV